VIYVEETASTVEQVTFRLIKGNGDVVVKQAKEDKNYED